MAIKCNIETHLHVHVDRINIKRYYISDTLQDVNDERPQFRSSFYAAEIPENAPKGTPVVFLGSAVNDVFDHDLGCDSMLNSQKGCAWN